MTYQDKKKPEEVTSPNSQWVEEVAAIQHDQWSGWMEYLFSKCNDNIDRFSLEPDGQLIIPAWAVERWKRQLLTKYADLSEEEKESDRKEAERYRELFETHAKEQVEAALKPILDAWTIKGSHPHYHDEVKQRVSQMWPSLFRAVENAINTLNEMSRDKDANK